MNFGFNAHEGSQGVGGVPPHESDDQRILRETKQRMEEERKKRGEPKYNSLEERHAAEKARFYANNPNAYNLEKGDDFIKSMKANMDVTYKEATNFNNKVFGKNTFTMPDPNETFEQFKERMKNEREAWRQRSSQKAGARTNQEQGHSTNQKEVNKEEREKEVTLEAKSMEELGISERERESIYRIDFILSGNQLAALAKKLFKVSDGKDKSAVKRAFQEMAQELHPDKQVGENISEEKKKMNGFKYSLINTFYNTKYKKYSF